MLIIGTDRIRVAGTAAAPDGTCHAVDPDGRVLCRASRARFTWPALPWDKHRSAEDACPLCTQVRNAQQALSSVAAYPASAAALAPAPTVSRALVPWQPTVGLFEPDPT